MAKGFLIGPVGMNFGCKRTGSAVFSSSKIEGKTRELYKSRFCEKTLAEKSVKKHWQRIIMKRVELNDVKFLINLLTSLSALHTSSFPHQNASVHSSSCDQHFIVMCPSDVSDM